MVQSRLVVVLVALSMIGSVAACSDPVPTSPLTAAEWDWCQGHWRDGLDASQRDEPNGSTWYFNNMGMPDSPATIRVCRSAVAKR